MGFFLYIFISVFLMKLCVYFSVISSLIVRYIDEIKSSSDVEYLDIRMIVPMIVPIFCLSGVKLSK